MNITFGMNLDGVRWSTKEATIGEVQTGPGGFLGLLETRLGLTAPTIHPVHRMNQYMTRLEEAEIPWVASSFSVDAWSTARQLLMWRDQLVEGGWNGKTPLVGSPRLESLTALEQSGLPLSVGTSDRIQTIKKQLTHNNSVEIDAIQLIEPRELFPPVWQQILALLEGQGTQITQWQPPIQVLLTSKKAPITSNESTLYAGNTNLYRVQEHILHGSKKDLPQGSLAPSDNSLLFLKAENEWEGAEHLAAWLAANQEENASVAIICGMDTSILDQALARHHLPKLGRSAPSKWREVQQILPLLLANAWTPIDIQRLVELLSLSISPFPSWVCRLLLSAMAREPGVNGKAWNQAMAKIEERRKLELTEKEDGNPEANARAWTLEIQNLLVDQRFDPVSGMTEEGLRLRCQKVINILGWKIGMDSRLATVVGQAKELETLSLGKGTIPRTTLERMLDTIMGGGTTMEDSLEEAAPWHAVDHPGQLTEGWDTVIWWGFQDNDRGETTYWNQEERKALQQGGIEIEEPWMTRRRESFGWEQGFLCARNQFIPVTLAQIDGAEAYHHPYWDTLWCAAAEMKGEMSLAEMQEVLLREGSRLGTEETWHFAGRKTRLKSVAPQVPPPIEPQRQATPGTIKPPKKLSYSQMSTLIGCPMKWALEYHAGLRLPESQTVPSGNQMIGTLCHRIVEELYAHNNQLTEAEAVTQGKILYDQLLPSMAAELLLDGNAVERQRYQTAVSQAVGKLVKGINQRHLLVEQTEAPLTANMKGIPFIGYADMLLRDREGKPYVLDLKWSYTDKHHRQGVEQGTALQLATYAWMLRSADSSSPENLSLPAEVAQQVDTGYFMLAQGTLLSDSASLTEEVLKTPYSLEQTWNMGVAAFEQAMAQLEKGTIEVRGVEEMITLAQPETTEEKLQEDLIHQRLEQGLLYQKPPCRFCDFGGICGKIQGNIGGGL